MKKDKLHLLTLLGISIIVFVIGYFSMNYLIRVSANRFLEIQIESSKREAREFSKLVALQIENGVDRKTVINNVQKSIEGTNIESGFICMFDWSGVEICHPNPQKVGKQTSPDESYVRPIDDGINSEDFYDLLKNKEQHGGVRDFTSDRSSEIIYLYPVKDTDWIIAAHANIDKLEMHIQQLKANFLLVYLLTSVIIILLSLFTVRFIGNYYEKELELRNEQLTDEVLSLSKLNSDLNSFKNKVASFEQEKNNNPKKEEENSTYKKRLLTYKKDKLITIKVEDISFINTELTLTTITCSNGNKFSSNTSLDELFNSIDPTLFFRANRQNILSVKGIDEILKYGNNQLKIITNPTTETPIIISKNKVSEFKKWLNM
ncbi:MAG: LytTR family transcriptional regulator DNA-binding domain-containing protein [Flavobacteriaceae bacterium]